MDLQAHAVRCKILGNPIIPKVTNPLGAMWQQPIILDSYFMDDLSFVVLSQSEFEKLPEYSYSKPSGVYAGKMWKAQSEDKWYLKFFVDDADPEYCIDFSILIKRA